MTDESKNTRPTGIQRIAVLLGLPEPEPWTEEEEREFQERMNRADAEVRARIARQVRPAA